MRNHNSRDKEFFCQNFRDNQFSVNQHVISTCTSIWGHVFRLLLWVYLTMDTKLWQFMVEFGSLMALVSLLMSTNDPLDIWDYLPRGETLPKRWSNQYALHSSYGCRYTLSYLISSIGMLLWLMTNAYLITPMTLIILSRRRKLRITTCIALRRWGASFPFAVAAIVEALYLSCFIIMESFVLSGLKNQTEFFLCLNPNAIGDKKLV